MCQYKSICNPIIELTTLLQSCGFTIEKQELKDWHFNEFEIVMKGKKLQLPMIDIEGKIKKNNLFLFFLIFFIFLIKIINKLK